MSLSPRCVLSLMYLLIKSEITSTSSCIIEELLSPSSLPGKKYKWPRWPAVPLLFATVYFTLNKITKTMSLSPKCAIAFWSSELYYPVWTQALNIKSWNYFWVFKQQNWDHQASILWLWCEDPKVYGKRRFFPLFSEPQSVRKQSGKKSSYISKPKL